MPKDEPDPEDPMTLVGMEIPVENDEALLLMAQCFAEEYARMGCNEADVLELFQDPFYGGAHAAYELMGEAAARELIAEACRAWPRRPVVGPHDNIAAGDQPAWEV